MASLYERHILPHIIRLGCGCTALAELRAPIVAQARGAVLELGIGAGANLPHYLPDRVGTLTAIEPAEELRAMAEKAAKAARLDARIIAASGEDLPFADAAFDTIVCTYTLCTVSDPDRTLREARRVLKPGGLLLLCEHGRSPDEGVARWQDRLDPLWGRIFGGCHLTRPVRSMIERHFHVEDWTTGYQPRTPRIAGWMERGRAIAA